VLILYAGLTKTSRIPYGLSLISTDDQESQHDEKSPQYLIRLGLCRAD